jgi:hypothetical protein
MIKTKKPPSSYDAVETAIGLAKLGPNNSWGELLRRSSPASIGRVSRTKDKNAPRSKGPCAPAPAA